MRVIAGVLIGLCIAVGAGAVVGGLYTMATTSDNPTPVPSVTPTPSKSVVVRAVPSETEPYYGNCTEAKRAGVAPLRRNQPGYRAALDRDGDGIACDK